MSQSEVPKMMDGWAEERAERLRAFFGLGAHAGLVGDDPAKFELSAEEAAGLGHFNIEWHIIPQNNSVPLDDAYMARLYPTATKDFFKAHEHGDSYRERLTKNHGRHQGLIIGVETTRKPRYLPENRQFYGTVYGHDSSADPFAPYLGSAGMMNGTRYDHNYLSLREFIRVVNDDWRARSIMPANYRATICPPAVFNLIGTIFHPEWSETETLELGFYSDPAGNATCYAVGSNSPGDFSYIAEVEGEGDWALMGFRVALVPE